MKQNKKIHAMFKCMSILSLMVAMVGCSTTSSEKNIRIGSKDFTENLIVSELYALALEDQGYTVDRVQNIAGSLIHTSIVNDEIDLYPEYIGTGLLSVLKLDLITDTQKAYEKVKKEYEQQYEITWLDYAQANDSQGLVIRADVAKEYGIENFSDLQANASKLRFASQGEFDEREDGLPLLEKIYGKFDWKSSNIYDNGLKYEILKNNQADVAPAYTTEGQLVNIQEFLILKDDKQVYPPYNIAPIIKDSVLESNPEIATILNKVSASLDNETIIKLNAKVDMDKQEYEAVAKEFYESIK